MEENYKIESLYSDSESLYSPSIHQSPFSLLSPPVNTPESPPRVPFPSFLSRQYTRVPTRQCTKIPTRQYIKVSTQSPFSLLSPPSIHQSPSPPHPLDLLVVVTSPVVVVVNSNEVVKPDFPRLVIVAAPLLLITVAGLAHCRRQKRVKPRNEEK